MHDNIAEGSRCYFSSTESALIVIKDDEREQKTILSITKCRRVKSEYVIAQNMAVHCVVQPTDRLIYRNRFVVRTWLDVTEKCLNIITTRKAGWSKQGSICFDRVNFHL